MVFGRRSDPEGLSRHETVAATGTVRAERNPPSLLTDTNLAPSGHTTEISTSRSFVNAAPSFRETPTGPGGGNGAIGGL